jgi:hypothetical protein
MFVDSSAVVYPRLSERTFAMPKSRIFVVRFPPTSLTKMFAGFTSRCATFWECATPSALAVGSSRATASARPSSGAPDCSRSFRYCARVSPSSHSITRYGTQAPASVVNAPTSSACTMPLVAFERRCKRRPSSWSFSSSSALAASSSAAGSLRHLTAMTSPKPLCTPR